MDLLDMLLIILVEELVGESAALVVLLVENRDELES